MTLGRDIVGDWQTAIQREWLVTNGIGGFACGTVAGANTRRYHGVLVASFKPPVERALLVSKADVCAIYRGQRYSLGANEFGDGTISPDGFKLIESFRLDEGIPTWRYALADAILEQQIFMAHGSNTSYLRLCLVRARAPLQIEITPLCNDRDYHSQARGMRPFVVTALEGACSLQSFPGARAIHLSLDGGRFDAAGDWYWNFWHRAEVQRGLDGREDLFMPGRFSATVEPSQCVYFIASTEPTPHADGAQVVAAIRQRSATLTQSLPDGAPAWIVQLARASDQFLVARTANQVPGASVIAGYPWFADWGRDTMIALPGLTSTLGRHSIAAQVLKTFAGFVDQGMLPNRFPDSGETPQYNTADATLWFFQAIREHANACGDSAFTLDLYPTLIKIIRAHVEGTRFGIQLDPHDALLRAGEPGTQLTWMDAKVGDWVVTPRIGKPVEINALWLNALQLTSNIANHARDQAGARYCDDLLLRGSASFARFWNEPGGFLFDVIDVDGTSQVDASLRPNQILAVSLPHCALSMAQMRSVVDACARELLTSYGLRSLSPRDHAYVGRYDGDQRSRDGAYHQGTVWSWLLGPFARAHHRVYADAKLARSFLAPIAQHLDDACLGTISEVFDADAPHAARGCFAQAWSVAEILRAWVYLENVDDG